MAYTGRTKAFAQAIYLKNRTTTNTKKQMPLYQDQKLKLYNSIAGSRFKPIHEGRIGMYVCGPTVYSNVHLGNCRTFISFDMILSLPDAPGYKVRYVRNITRRWAFNR
jgi:hypothetical protein